jgi:uncharacterized membrane protein YidH (DUF202 family)
MNKPENMETRLWDYIDGLSSGQERSFVAKLIEENQEWNNKYHELLDVHQLMQQNIELDEPSMRFTQNVMEGIAQEKIAPAASSYIKKSVIRGIAAFFLISLGALLIYIFATLDWSTLNSQEPSIKVPDLNVSKYLSSGLFKGMAIVTAVLTLALLDMTIRRKQKKNREMMDQ